MNKFTVAALMLALATPVLADKPQKPDKTKNKDKDKGQSSAPAHTVTVLFGDHDREVVRTYYSEKYGRGNCPPGLAKKNNGCLPPGQAKKRYQIGQPLPREVVWVEAPHELVVRLTPAPSGYKYAVVDGDLVKLALGTLLVVDAINGLF